MSENGLHKIPVMRAAPNPALAILEESVLPDTGDDWLGEAVNGLRKHIQIRDKRTAEAKAQAELEAEAFNLYRAYMAVHEPMNAIGDWQMLAEGTKEDWLAVARKAREMAKEATK